MKRLDPLTPDRLVRPGRVTLDGVAQEGRAVGQLQLEPVLALQPLRPDHPERTCGAGAIELFPEHEPGVVQAVPVQPGRRSDLPRPDAVEVRDEGSDPFWRRWDDPLMAVPDLHPPLTSSFVPVDCVETQRFALLEGGRHDVAPTGCLRRCRGWWLRLLPSRMLNMSAAIGLGLLSALRPNSAPYRDTAGLPGHAVGKPVVLCVLFGAAVIRTYLVRPLPAAT